MSEEKKGVAVRQEPVKSLLEMPAIKKRFDDVLGSQSPAFVSSIISAVNSNSYLKRCDPMSVVSSAAIAASMNLPINSSLGFAHIVPYGNVAQFQMGWRGFVQLALRSGEYKTINAAIVYEGQIKDHNQFTGEMTFNQSAKSEKIEGYLLYFRLLNGYEKYFYMTADECEKHGKRYSQTYQKNKGRWVEDFDAMALKTVVKMGLSKYGILSVEMRRAIEVDQATFDENGNPVFVDRPEEQLPAGSYEAPEYVPGVEPRTTLAALVSEGKDAHDAKEFFSTIHEQLLTSAGKEWADKLLAEMRKQGVEA